MIRHIDIPGLYNLRDTGGYRAGEGTTRWGKLFRSDSLHQLEGEAQRSFVATGIRHIIDLRSEHERTAWPSRIDGLGLTVHHVPVFAGAATRAQARADVTLERLYRHIVTKRGERLVEAIRTIAHVDPGEAVLVHCAAGKDRTGLVIAFALAAVGVDRDEIAHDYALTEQHLVGDWTRMTLERLELRDPPASYLQLVSSSPAELMVDVLDRVDEAHGSVGNYLTHHGLDPAEIDRLAEALID